MTATPLISVIIPVFNAGSHLQSCLQSISSQSTESIEILCVDDCSSDNSVEILELHQRVDHRIKIFKHEANKGCAAARNTGLLNAQGKYIYFIDSDDWIDANYLEELLEIAEGGKLHVVYNCRILLEKEDGTSELFEPGNYAANIGFDTTGYIDSRPNIGNFAYSNCCCLYLRDYLKKLNVTFPEGLDYTDNYFHIATFLPQEKIYVTNKNAYHYRIHDDSICAKNRDSILRDDILHVYELIMDYYVQHGFIEYCKLNFFELKKYIHRLSGTAAGYEKLHHLLKKSFELIMKNPHLYREEELHFFKAVCNSADYTSYVAAITNATIRSQLKNGDETKRRFNLLRERAQKHLKVAPH